MKYVFEDKQGKVFSVWPTFVFFFFKGYKLIILLQETNLRAENRAKKSFVIGFNEDGLEKMSSIGYYFLVSEQLELLCQQKNMYD